jgi:hypothetical protein
MVQARLNPCPKSATPRSLHAYLSSFVSPAAIGTSKKRCRQVRWFLTHRMAQAISLCDASIRSVSKPGEA